jgi:hypothetical protein
MDGKHEDQSPINITQAAKMDFSRAYSKGFWRSILNWVRNQNNELLPFDEVIKHTPMKGRYDLGYREIETDKVIGSVSRYLDFDRAFLPRQTHTRSRWESIDRAYFQDVILPPIEVYKIGEVYFIKDGNHRVSVARERGQKYMDAYVTEVKVTGKIDEKTDIKSLVLEQEYNEFIAQTSLDKLYPYEDFHFSMPGQYNKILQHISVHRWFIGERKKEELSEEESIKAWYRDLYKPLIKIIREHEILKSFPHRTEMDLYLWIIEHRYYLAEEQHKRVSLESAALHFKERFAEKPFRHMRQFWHWLKRKLGLRK